MQKKEKTIKLMSGGSTPITLFTKANTWGEFKKEISGEIDLPEPHAAILGETKAILIDESILPHTVEYKGKIIDTFHIYVTPKRSKSGRDYAEVSYKECRSIIKVLRSKSDKAVKFFGDYTHMTTADMRKKLKKWFKKNTPESAKAEPTKAKAKAKAKVTTKSKAKVTTSKKVIDKKLAEKVVPTKQKTLVVESNSGAVAVLEQVLNFLKGANKDSKVIFTLDEVLPSDYSKMKKLIS